MAEEPPSRLKIERTSYGKMVDGQQVDLYTMTNSHGMEVSVMTLGATLTTVKTPDRAGRIDTITLHKQSLDEYEKGHPLFGSVVGRYANRIADAKFTIDGVDCSLAKNAGKHHIHGGGRNEGFAWQVWKGQAICETDAVGVRLTLRSPHGQAGFPGTLDVTVTYELTADNRLIMHYIATTDRPTHVNLTNHAYWNLAGADSGKDVAAHRLTINADRYLLADESKMPTGEIGDVQGTAMDFTGFHPIGEHAAETDYGYYDHCYVLKKTPNEKMSLCARVTEPTSGRTMTVYTTQPGVQLYNGNPLGLCLETQHFPNSPNEPSFPSTLLRPDEKFEETTIHHFGILK